MAIVKLSKYVGPILVTSWLPRAKLAKHKLLEIKDKDTVL